MLTIIFAQFLANAFETYHFFNCSSFKIEQVLPPNLQSALHRATVSKSYSLWTPTRSEHNKRAKIGSLRGLFGKFLCLPAAVVGRLSSIKHKNLVPRYSARFCWTKSRFGRRRKKNHPKKPRCVSATETIARLVSFFLVQLRFHTYAEITCFLLGPKRQPHLISVDICGNRVPLFSRGGGSGSVHR